MKCKDVRLWLLDRRGESRILPDQIKRHVRSCSSCGSFRDDLSAIQGQMDILPQLAPPSSVLEGTRRLCLSSLEADRNRDPELQRGNIRLPKIIWAAVLLLLGLTAGMVATLFTEINISEGLNPKSALIVTIMIQNAVMLFFTPVLLRKHRSARPDSLFV